MPSTHHIPAPDLVTACSTCMRHRRCPPALLPPPPDQIHSSLPLPRHRHFHPLLLPAPSPLSLLPPPPSAAAHSPPPRPPSHQPTCRPDVDFVVEVQNKANNRPLVASKHRCLPCRRCCLPCRSPCPLLSTKSDSVSEQTVLTLPTSSSIRVLPFRLVSSSGACS